MVCTLYTHKNACGTTDYDYMINISLQIIPFSPEIVF